MAAGLLIRNSVLAVLHPEYAVPVLQELLRVNWTITTIESTLDLGKHTADAVGCLLLDSARKPLVDEVLAWCENSGNWRSVPKVIIGVTTKDYSNTLKLRRDDVQSRLITYLIDSQSQFREHKVNKWNEKRAVYRHNCSLPITIEQNFTLLDVSVRGAAFESFHSFNNGTLLHIHISKDDPFLHSIEAEVTSTERRTSATFTIHSRFTNVSSAVDRALNRYLLSLQVRRVGSGYRPAI